MTDAHAVSSRRIALYVHQIPKKLCSLRLPAFSIVRGVVVELWSIELASPPRSG